MIGCEVPCPDLAARRGASVARGRESSAGRLAMPILSSLYWSGAPHSHCFVKLTYRLCLHIFRVVASMHSLGIAGRSVWQPRLASWSASSFPGILACPGIQCTSIWPWLGKAFPGRSFQAFPGTPIYNRGRTCVVPCDRNRVVIGGSQVWTHWTIW